MAITNTLQKCLESPYLFADAEAPGRVADLMAQARSRAEGAARLLSGEKPDAVDVGALAHEAMFAAIRALVYAKGYRESGLRCLLLAAEGFYVRPGLLDGGHLLAYERVQGMKLPPAEAVEAARGLVERAGQLVES